MDVLNISARAVLGNIMRKKRIDFKGFLLEMLNVIKIYDCCTVDDKRTFNGI